MVSILDRYIAEDLNELFVLEQGSIKEYLKTDKTDGTKANVRESLQKEADVIVTATVLGFIGTRYYLEQPCQFDFEYPSRSKWKKWEKIDQIPWLTVLMDWINKEMDTLNNFYEVELQELIKKQEKQSIKELSQKKNQQQKRLYETCDLKITNEKKQYLSELEKELKKNKELRDNLAKQGADNPKLVEMDKEIKATKAQITAIDTEDSFPTAKDLIEYKEFNEDQRKFMYVIDAMALVLDTYPGGDKIGDFLKDGQSSAKAELPLITGKSGGAGQPYKNTVLKANGRSPSIGPNQLEFDLTVIQTDTRSKDLRNEAAKNLINEVANNELKNVYRGKGAYTGMVDDPVDEAHTLLAPTLRVIVPNMDKKLFCPQGEKITNWGLIDAASDELKNQDTNPEGIFNLAPLPKGMGPLPKGEVKPPMRIGYIHGMSSAIVDSVGQGPWCTPYELATGDETTKVASCFACTTYMYAAGYPPSSTHLGRGESWYLPTSKLSPGMAKIEINSSDKKVDANYSIPIMDSLATRWHTEVYKYMFLGKEFLEEAIKARQLVEEDRASIIKEKLSKALETISQVNNKPDSSSSTNEEKIKMNSNAVISTIGGNLFLDALTVFDSDWKRIQRTLKPAYEKAKKAEENQLNFSTTISKLKSYIKGNIVSSESLEEMQKLVTTLQQNLND